MSRERLNSQLKELFKKNDGKGLEKIVSIIGDTITKVEISLTNVFEGKPTPKGKKYKNPLDRGIVPIVREVSAIDLCNILTYVVNKSPELVKKIPTAADKRDGSNDKADSTKKEARSKTEFEKTIESLQDKAYEAQLLIDNYYVNFSNANNSDSRIGLYNLTTNLQLVFSNVNEASSLLNEANNNIKDLFPQVSAYNAFLQNVFGYFNRFSDLSTASTRELDKIKSYVDKTRGVLVAIQALDPKNPAKLVGLGVAFLSPKIQDDLNKLNKIINPDKLLPFVKNIQAVCVNIQNSVRLVLSIIRRAQAIISTAVNIVRVLQIVRRIIYILLVALPNLFLTAGVNQAFSDGLNKIKEFLDKIIKALSQVNNILLRVVVVVEYIISQIEEILNYIKIIIANLENCNNADPIIVKDLKDVAKSLENSLKTLKDFRNNYENKKYGKNNTFGDKDNKYSINIITEQLADEGIALKRRYGVALDKNGILVASSTPTFASDDNVIIGEVKLILVSKKLVNPEMSELSADSINTINESLNFLEDDEISIEDFNIEADFDINTEDSLDDPDNENEEKGIGLNAFANKLPGGKKLRERVRKKIASILGTFTAENPSVRVPVSRNVTQTGGGSGTSQTSTANSNSTYNKEERIKQLEEKREELKKQRRRALLAGPAGAAIVAAKTKEIRDIDKEIQQLRK